MTIGFTISRAAVRAADRVQSLVDGALPVRAGRVAVAGADLPGVAADAAGGPLT